MGTTGLRVAVAIFAATVRTAFGAVETIPCSAAVAATSVDPAAAAFEVTADVRVYDPLHQIDRHAPLSVALGEQATQTRLAFIRRRLDDTRGRLKIVLNRHDTQVYRSWVPAEAGHFGPEDFQARNRVLLAFSDWQDEHPDVVTFGALVEAATMLLNESSKYGEHRNDTLDEVIEFFRRRRIAKWRDGNEKDRRDADALEAFLADGAKARWQTLQTFQLRNTWIAKIHFYRKYLPAHPELGMVFGIPAAATLRRLAELDSAVSHARGMEDYDRASEAFENALRDEFTRFYSQHAGYRLDRTLVRAAWAAPQPRLLESSLICPEVLLEPGLFP